jgi:hypothetical protein
VGIPIGATRSLAQTVTSTQQAVPSGSNRVSELERLNRNLQDLQGQAEADPVQLAAAHLKLANFMLAEPAGVSATNQLLGIALPAGIAQPDNARNNEQDDNGRHAISLAEAAGRSQVHIDAADKTLEGIPAEEEIDEDRYAELKSAARTLRAFADVFSLTDQEPTGPDKQAWSDAARGLAMAREAKAPEVAAAARMWQAYALNRAGNYERALATLPEVLSKPEVLSYGFVSRLLRCRILVENDRHAAAMTLAIRMEPIAAEWFDRRSGQRQARALVRLMQRDLAERLIDRMRADHPPLTTQAPDTQPTASSEVLLARRIAERLGEPGFESPYILEAAVPIFIGEPPAR